MRVDCLHCLSVMAGDSVVYIWCGYHVWAVYFAVMCNDLLFLTCYGGM